MNEEWQFEEQRLAAYRLWQERGSPVGSPEEDWFRAGEEDLCARRLAAYRLWQKRGSPIGSPEYDWWRASRFFGPSVIRDEYEPVPPEEYEQHYFESKRSLAYELWQDRGSPIGSPLKDWFEAEMYITRATYHGLGKPYRLKRKPAHAESQLV